MCSILAILDAPPSADLRERGVALSRLQRHRGPDWSGVHFDGANLLVHERLSIVDVEGGAQPIVDLGSGAALAVNGEIYNHRELRSAHAPDYAYTTGSDCEVILALYLQEGVAFLDRLNGIFAFVLTDPGQGRSVIARDPIGVIPLYWGRDAEGTLLVASELKALVPVCQTVSEFPPGHVWTTGQDAPVRYHQRDWTHWDSLCPSPADPPALASALDAAVRRQMMTDVPWGALLSGGLDSSVIAALACRHRERRVEDDGQSPAWWPSMHTFCIGLADSPDLIRAREVADHLGTVHHGFTYTVQEGLDVMREVIWHLETFDVTTIRSAIPMYLMARRIRAMGIKMVLSGEGADEVFGGYLYFHHAPDARAFHEETVRKLERLHLYDCLRANKAMAAWGIEARVPFLDTQFLDHAMRIDPEARRPRDGIEKYLIRQALGDLLPESVAWRQKEQFSDGVGYGWIDALKEHAASRISSDEVAEAAALAADPSLTAEAILYRRIFREAFPLSSAWDCVPQGASVACSTSEALLWTPELATGPIDPSGRAVRAVHRDAL